MPPPSPDPETATWVHDTVDQYRLNSTKINDYLTKKWGNYDFFVELKGDKFQMWIPRKLKQVEKDALEALQSSKK